jgi:hypothetical protein
VNGGKAHPQPIDRALIEIRGYSGTLDRQAVI